MLGFFIHLLHHDVGAHSSSPAAPNQVQSPRLNFPEFLQKRQKKGGGESQQQQLPPVISTFLIREAKGGGSEVRGETQH